MVSMRNRYDLGFVKLTHPLPQVVLTSFQARLLTFEGKATQMNCLLLAFVTTFGEDCAAKQVMVPHAMKYKVELKPRAIKDLNALSVVERTRLIARIENL